MGITPKCHVQNRLSTKTVIPNLLAPGTGFVEDNFSTDGWWGESWKTFFPWTGAREGVWFRVQAVLPAMGSDGEQWGVADEASLTCLQLTSCYVARFLTDQGPVAVL